MLTKSATILIGDFWTNVEVVFGTTADEGLLYMLTALNNPTELDLWR